MHKIIIHGSGGSQLTLDTHTKSNDGLHVFLHRARTGGRPFVRDANQAYDIKVRRIATGSDFSIRLFAASQEDAERRAKERARSAYGISPDKYRELEKGGTAVFRIVSSEVSKNQERAGGDSAGSFLRPGSHRPETRAKNTPIADKVNSDNPAELRAAGRQVQQYCDTSKEVREWARSEGYSRAQEAFIVEGFKQARISAGLSENV